MTRNDIVIDDEAEADVSILDEARAGLEILLLHASPVYYGFGVPRGDNSAVILIPGFLSADLFLMELYGWLHRVGYRPYFSGIGFNTECPNLLIQIRLRQTIEKAFHETGARCHLIGHSLGGIIARSLAAQMPDKIASVISLGAPFRGTVAHSSILRAAKAVRSHILARHGSDVLPECYTSRCACDFVDHLKRDLPAGVAQTAIYTQSDGVVDWHHCVTGDPDIDFEVAGTHIGLVFNPTVYFAIATRLAAATARAEAQPVRTKRVR